MAHSLQSSRTCLGTPTTHTRSSLLVPRAFKRNNQQNQPRNPGWLDLPPLDPKEYQQPQTPNGPQQQPGQWQQTPVQQPAVNPQGPQPGYINNNPYTQPAQGQPNNNNNNRRYGGGGGGYQQPLYNPNFSDPTFPGFLPPPSQQNGGYNQRGGGRYSNNRGKFQGFDMSNADLLLQDLLQGNTLNDRWLPDDEEFVVEEDTSPKYVNGKQVLVNSQIEAPQVRVQDSEKVELGVMSFDEARSLAMKDGIDVVMINDNGDPPVVRLIKFDKYKFELERAAKQKQKNSSKGTETKEIRLRPVTEAHDYEVKVKQARNFLGKGNKVKLTMQFSGRELRFKDQGKEMMLKLIEDLSTTSKMDAPLSLRPATFSVTLSPLK